MKIVQNKVLIRCLLEKKDDESNRPILATKLWIYCLAAGDLLKVVHKWVEPVVRRGKMEPRTTFITEWELPDGNIARIAREEISRQEEVCNWWPSVRAAVVVGRDGNSADGADVLAATEPHFLQACARMQEALMREIAHRDPVARIGYSVLFERFGSFLEARNREVEESLDLIVRTPTLR